MMEQLMATLEKSKVVQRADPTIYYIPTKFVDRFRDGGARIEYIPEFDIYLMHPSNVGLFKLMMDVCDLKCTVFPEADPIDAD